MRDVKITNGDELRLILKYLAFIEFDGYMLTDSYELYSYKKGLTEANFKNAEEALKYPIEGVTVGDRLKRITYSLVLKGGRGASQTEEMGGGFGGAGMGDDSETKPLFPATFNTQGRFVSQAQAVRDFSAKYKDADREYAIAVDEAGFTHKHVRGGRSSVAINATGKNQLIVHNHPNGSHFSDADLKNTAASKKSSGIVAVGSKYTYTLKKGPRFKGAEFSKAVSSAQWPKRLDYNKGADWWLKKNAKEYGYTYTRSKT